MSQAEDEVQRRREGRSPSYPGINLQKALERAQQMYDEERRNVAHVDTILKHWGYSPKTGPGRIAFAALKKYGLMIEEGSGAKRRGRLSDLALRILLDERPNSAERRQAIQRAALMPPIHRELWEEYQGTLPSDENLRASLRMDRHFTDNGATDFIRNFRATLAFAGLEGPDSMSPDGGDTEGEADMSGGGGSGTMTPPAPPADQDAFRVPLGTGRAAFLRVPSPFTERDWDLMLRVLEAMKPGLVEPEPPPPTSAGSETEEHEG